MEMSTGVKFYALLFFLICVSSMHRGLRTLRILEFGEQKIHKRYRSMITVCCAIDSEDVLDPCYFDNEKRI